MEHITEISENINTRYITQVSEGKAYLSEWGTDVIHVIDLNNYEIIKSISVGQDPEEIVVSNGFAYVCNSGNSFGSIDNTVSVIDISNDEVVNTLVLNDKPTSASVDGLEIYGLFARVIQFMTRQHGKLLAKHLAQYL